MKSRFSTIIIVLKLLLYLNIDLYLVDMYDKPIEQRITPAHEFYKREAEKIKKLMVFIKENIKEGK